MSRETDQREGSVGASDDAARREGAGRAGLGVRECRATARHWLPFVGLVAGLFLAVAVVGAAVGYERRSPVVPIRSPGDTVPRLAPLHLFAHNGQVALLLVVGLLLFGLPTVAILAYNAILFGATTAAALGSFGPLATLAILLPHGLFELPGLWLAGAISFRWLWVLWQTTQGGDRRVSVDRTVVETVFAVLAVIVLLGVAAVVEGTITKSFAAALT